MRRFRWRELLGLIPTERPSDRAIRTCLELLGIAGQAFSVNLGVAAITTAAANLVK